MKSRCSLYADNDKKGCDLHWLQPFFVFINATYEGADANTPIAEALLLHAEAALLQIEALPLQLKVMLLALKALLLSLKALLLPVFYKKTKTTS